MADPVQQQSGAPSFWSSLTWIPENVFSLLQRAQALVTDQTPNYSDYCWNSELFNGKSHTVSLRKQLNFIFLLYLLYLSSILIMQCVLRGLPINTTSTRKYNQSREDSLLLNFLLKYTFCTIIHYLTNEALVNPFHDKWASSIQVHRF